MNVPVGARWRRSTRLAAVIVGSIVLLAVRHAGAACTGGRCSDELAVATMRNMVAAECNCDDAASPRRYLRCAKLMIRAAVAAGHLPAPCKRVALRCEAKTTCGRAGAVVCCRKNGKGRVKGRVVKKDASCRGSVCDGMRDARDACTAAGECVTVVATATTTTTTTTSTTPTTNPTLTAPFRSVQQVFQGSCALSSCHSSLARQGNLVLDSEDVSYQSLVDRPSFEPRASAMGLLRVKSGDPQGSFLIRKLRGLGPGDPMPQGTPPLPDPVIAMLENWIARGAHSTEEECPAVAVGSAQPQHGGGAEHTICDDPPIPGEYVWKPQPPLEVPAAGKGIQLYVPQRDVDPGTEWETCYAFKPNWPELAAAAGYAADALPAIERQEYRMHDGSHHLLLYAYFGQHPEQWAEGFFPCFAANCVRPGDCPIDSGENMLPIGGTQVAGTRYVVTYPPGVGIPVLGRSMVLIANLHYTNPFQPPQAVRGEAWLNLHFQDPGEFKALLDGIFAINFQDMFVEPYETRTFSRIWKPRSILGGAPADAAVFQLFGHMHKRGEAFQIDYVRDGKCSVSQALCGRDDDCACKPYQRSCQAGQTCVRGPDAQDVTIYYTTKWDHAPVVDFPRPHLHVDQDEGLRWTCTHTNGYADDPTRPPKRCHEDCNSCGWNAATRTCKFTRGIAQGHQQPRPGDDCTVGDGTVRCITYAEGEAIPVVFGELADDDMCNMFGYFIPQSVLPLLE